MNLEELRSVQRAERQKDSLQHLRDEFYEDVAAYIAQLKNERERAVAAADDPFASDDVRRLTDEIESTKETANALYERRVGKVVKHASFAAADMATDEDGMTVEERDLFDDLVGRIRENRQTVLATLEGNADDAAAEPEPGGPSPATAGSTESGESTEEAEAADSGGSDRTGTDVVDPPDTPEPAADDLLSDALGGGESAESPAAVASERDASAESARGAESRPDESTPAAGETVGEDRPAGEAATVSDDPTEVRSDAADTTDTERTVLRITADVGTVYGVDDREYDLVREDVVTLPTTNAEPLLQKDAAERID
jgi:DNA replication factor GINS